MPDLEIVKKNISKQQIAYMKIKNAIILNQIKPGEPLIERELCDTFDISRTPVREALHMLNSTGLIDFFPGKGAFVSRVNNQDMIELLELSEIIETTALRYGTKSYNESTIEKIAENLREQEHYLEKNQNDRGFFWLDNAFHEILVKEAHHERLYKMLETINDQMARLRALTLCDKEQEVLSYKSHLDIYRYIKKYDMVNAEKLLREHYSIAKNYHTSHMIK